MKITQNISKLIWVSIFLVSGSISLQVFASESIERIVWDKAPLKITLPVGTERRVTFPSPVRIGLPSSLSQTLRTQINNNTVYWLAQDEFTAQRIEIRAVDGSVIYLVDLNSKKTRHHDEPIEVTLKSVSQSRESLVTQKKASSVTSDSTYSNRPSPSYIVLSRFAAQQLYAPLRLLKKPFGIHRVPINRGVTTYLFRGALVSAKPIAAWKQQSLYVTALEITNLSTEHISLDPRKIRGQWKAATFQYVRIHPKGSELDTTALYLISDRPFHEVL